MSCVIPQSVLPSRFLMRIEPPVEIRQCLTTFLAVAKLKLAPTLPIFLFLDNKREGMSHTSLLQDSAGLCRLCNVLTLFMCFPTRLDQLGPPSLGHRRQRSAWSQEPFVVFETCCRLAMDLVCQKSMISSLLSQVEMAGLSGS